MEGRGRCKLLKAQPLELHNITSRVFYLSQQVSGPAQIERGKGTTRGCECQESWFIADHLWKLVTTSVL